MTVGRERECDECKKLFTHQRIDVRFCEEHRGTSRKPKPKARPLIPLRICEVCSTEYRPRQYNQRFCDRACNKKFNNKNAKPRKKPFEKFNGMRHTIKGECFSKKEVIASTRGEIKDAMEDYFKKGGKVTRCKARMDFEYTEDDYALGMLDVDAIIGRI